jgi:hypothetical protein
MKSVIITATVLMAGLSFGKIEKQVSLVTGEALGHLAVAGRLSIDLHTQFMMSRTYEKDTILNWYNCGYSGGSKFAPVGGTFGNFGFDVPWQTRDARYPHASKSGEMQVAQFNGKQTIKGNFAIEEALSGKALYSIEVWFISEQGAKGDVILGWQSADGKTSSGTVKIPDGFKASSPPAHLTLVTSEIAETWYLNGKKLGSKGRQFAISSGHVPVLGGASESAPSFKGELIAFRLHDKPLTEEQVLHNFAGGVMLGTELHDWYAPDKDAEKYMVRETKGSFRHAVDKKRIEQWKDKPRELEEYKKRVPGMYVWGELLLRTYTERLAMRSSHVSRRPEKRGDGIKYTHAIQDTDGSWMGCNDDFGWACQFAGHLNPHELVHGLQAQTGGGIQGNFWEAHANFPQTYNGIYQTMPPSCVTRVSCFPPANGRDFYHDRLFFEHLAQAPEFGPMFISRLWYDGAIGTNGEKEKNPYPFLTFSRLNPYKETSLAQEYIKMAMRNVTWDYTTFADVPHGQPGNTPFGNDGVVSKENRYLKDAERDQADIKRFAYAYLQPVPYEEETYRVPRAQAPLQLGWNLCPLILKPNTKSVSVLLTGHVNPARGGDWRFGIVSVDAEKKATYSEIGLPDKKLRFSIPEGTKELYLVVAAIPTNIMTLNMVGDFRSFEYEPFPFKVQLTGCEPAQPKLFEKPANMEGAPHPNGGGFVAKSATVEATAYVGKDALVLGRSKVLGNARILDFAVINNATVQDQAVVSGHALVERDAVVSGDARVRDHAKISNRAQIRDQAKVLENGQQETNFCQDQTVVKGMAASFGENKGSPMIDGMYAKANKVTGGKWFTWSWGVGQNAGEVTNDFKGLYLDMQFNTPHPWMAVDDFGVTWGYLCQGAMMANGSLVLDGSKAFVELPKDVADFQNVTYKLRVKSNASGKGPILDFANSTTGDAVRLGEVRDGKLCFAISLGKTFKTLIGPALEKGKWNDIEVTIANSSATMKVDGKIVDTKTDFGFKPEMVMADRCKLGRNEAGKCFDGEIDTFQIYSVVKQEK